MVMKTPAVSEEVTIVGFDLTSDHPRDEPASCPVMSDNKVPRSHPKSKAKTPAS